MAEQDGPESKQRQTVRSFLVKFTCVVISCIVAHLLLDALVGQETLEKMHWIGSVGLGVGIAIGLIIGDYLSQRK